MPGEPGLVGEGEGQEGVELGLEGVGLQEGGGGAGRPATASRSSNVQILFTFEGWLVVASWWSLVVRSSWTLDSNVQDDSSLCSGVD